MPAAKSRIRINPKVLWQFVEPGAVLIDSATGTCFELNRVGADIWKRLLEEASENEIVTALAASYSIPPSAFEADFHRLLAELSRNGLLTFSD